MMMRFSTVLFTGILSLLSFNSSAAIDPLIDAADRQDVNAPILAASQKSTESPVRAKAATALGRILKPESVDPLLALLKDSDPHVVRQALFALGQLGWSADFNGNREKEIVEQIKPFLTSTSEKTRSEAVHAIGKLAYDETPTIVEKMLADSSPMVREESVIALFRYRYAMSMRGQTFTPWSDDFSQKVLTLVSDTSSDVRRALAFIYSRHLDIRGLGAATVLAQDLNATIRVHAVNALKRIGNTASLPLILKSLQDPSKEVRYAACEALAGMQNYDLFDESMLKSISRDPYFAVRKKIAELLGKSKVPGNRALYTKMLIQFNKDKSRAVASAAYLSLVRLLLSGSPAPVEQKLVETTLDYLMRSKTWEYRLAGMQAYVSILSGASENPTPLQQKALQIVRDGAISETHQLVRMSALSKMVDFKGTAGWEAVKRASVSALFSERGEALSAVASREEPEADKIAFLTSYYQASMDPKLEEPRGWTVEVLHELKSEGATEALKNILSDPSPAIVAAATKELRSRGVMVPDAAPVPLTFSPYREWSFKRNPTLFFHTARGKIEIEGLSSQAPIHVANFVGLAVAGFYDGKAFQRVVTNFVVQGGAADLNGYSTDTYSLRAEMNRVRYTRGAIGMPRSSAFDSGGSQIFINQITSPWLDGLYTVFARVVSGMDVVDRMEIADEILKVEVRL